jgi:hypothetical protein
MLSVEFIEGEAVADDEGMRLGRMASRAGLAVTQIYSQLHLPPKAAALLTAALKGKPPKLR